MYSGDEQALYTRMSEHQQYRHEISTNRLFFAEYSRECCVNGIPNCPTHRTEGKAVPKHYLELAQEEKGVSFVGPV